MTDNDYWVTTTGPGSGISANCYLAIADAHVCLIDPGLSVNLNPVARALHAAGRSPYDVTDILLTHYDHDHAQSAAEWQRRTGAQVWIGDADADILCRICQPPSPRRRTMAAFMDLPELPENLHRVIGETEILPGVRAIPTPGHTNGHLAYVHGLVAYIGDAARAGLDGYLRPGPAPLMTDVAQADRTREEIAGWDVEWYAAGHSAPVRKA